jgi:hypothetical protein
MVPPAPRLRAAERRIAVIVPLRPGETSWCSAMPALAKLPPGSELIFASPAPPSGATSADLSHVRVAWLKTPLGRARQMNLAARSTTASHLWFVHADTDLDTAAVTCLQDAVRREPDALHYFDLRFRDGSPLMMVNQVGVWVRTRVFGLPFGDQAFCLPRAALERLGGYDESVSYGEDHLLVWQAARGGLPLRRVGATIGTSARKYVERGWLETTIKHLYLTYKQAIPQWWQTRVKN